MVREAWESESNYNVPLVTVVTNLDTVTSPTAIAEEAGSPFYPASNDSPLIEADNPTRSAPNSPPVEVTSPKAPNKPLPLSPLSTQSIEARTENQAPNSTVPRTRKRFSLGGILAAVRSSVKPVALSVRTRLSRAISRNSALPAQTTPDGNNDEPDGEQLDHSFDAKAGDESQALSPIEIHPPIQVVSQEEGKVVETSLPIHVRVVQVATILLLLACLVVTVNAVICVAQYKKAYSRPVHEIVRNAHIVNGNIAFGNDGSLRVNQLYYIDRPSNLKMALGSLVLAPNSVATGDGDTFSIAGGNHNEIETLLNEFFQRPNSELELIDPEEGADALNAEVVGQATRIKLDNLGTKSITSLSFKLSDTSLNTRSFWFTVGAHLDATIEVIFAENLYHCLTFKSPFCVKIDLVANVRTLYLVGRDIEKSITLFINDPEVDVIEMERKLQTKERETKVHNNKQDTRLFANIKDDLFQLVSGSKLQFASFDNEWFKFAFYPKFVQMNGKSDFNLFFTLPAVGIDVLKQDDWNRNGTLTTLGTIELELTNMTVKMTPDAIDHMEGEEEFLALKMTFGDFESAFRHFFVELKRGEFAIRFANSSKNPSILGTLLAFMLNNRSSLELKKTIFKSFDHFPGISINLSNNSKMAEVSLQLQLPRIHPVGTLNSIHVDVVPLTKLRLYSGGQKLCKIQWAMNEFAFSFDQFNPDTFEWDDSTCEKVEFTFKLEFYKTYDSWILMEFAKRLGKLCLFPDNDTKNPLLLVKVNNDKKYAFPAQRINNYLWMMRNNENTHRSISGSKTFSAVLDLNGGVERNSSFRLQTPLPLNQPPKFQFDKWSTGVEHDIFNANIDIFVDYSNAAIRWLRSMTIFLAQFIYPTDLPSHIRTTIRLPSDTLCCYVEMNALKIFLVKIELKQALFEQLIPLVADKESQSIRVPFQVTLQKTAETEMFFAHLNWLKISAKLQQRFDFVGEVPDKRFKYSLKDVDGLTKMISDIQYLGYIGNWVMLLSTHTIKNPTLVSTLAAAMVGPIETGAMDGIFNPEGLETPSSEPYQMADSIIVQEMNSRRTIITARIPIAFGCDWLRVESGKGFYAGINENEPLTLAVEQELPDLLVFVENESFCTSPDDSLESIRKGSLKRNVWKTATISLNGTREFSNVSHYLKGNGTPIPITRHPDILVRNFKGWSDFSPRLRSIAKLFGGIILNQKFKAFISFGICRKNPIKLKDDIRFTDWSARQIIFPMAFTAHKSKYPSPNGVTQEPKDETGLDLFAKLNVRAVKPMSLNMIDLRFENIRIVTNVLFPSGKEPLMEYFDFNMRYDTSNEPLNNNRWLSSREIQEFYLYNINDKLDMSVGLSLKFDSSKFSFTRDSVNFTTIRKPHSQSQITIPMSLEYYPAIVNKVDPFCTFPEQWKGDGGQEFFTAGKEVIPQLFASETPRGVKISASHSMVIKFQCRFGDLPDIPEDDWIVWTTEREEFIRVVQDFQYGIVKIHSLGQTMRIRNIPLGMQKDTIITLCIYFSPLTGRLEVIFNGSGEQDSYYVTRYRAVGYYQMTKERNIVIDNQSSPIVDEADVEAEEEGSFEESEEEQSEEKQEEAPERETSDSVEEEDEKIEFSYEQTVQQSEPVALAMRVRQRSYSSGNVAIEGISTNSLNIDELMKSNVGENASSVNDYRLQYSITGFPHHKSKKGSKSNNENYSFPTTPADNYDASDPMPSDRLSGFEQRFSNSMHQFNEPSGKTVPTNKAEQNESSNHSASYQHQNDGIDNATAEKSGKTVPMNYVKNATNATGQAAESASEHLSENSVVATGESPNEGSGQAFVEKSQVLSGAQSTHVSVQYSNNPSNNFSQDPSLVEFHQNCSEQNSKQNSRNSFEQNSQQNSRNSFEQNSQQNSVQNSQSGSMASSARSSPRHSRQSSVGSCKQQGTDGSRQSSVNNSRRSSVSSQLSYRPSGLLSTSFHFVYPDFAKSRLVWDTARSSYFVPGIAKQLKLIHYDAEETMVHLPTEIYCQETEKMQNLFSIRIIHKRLAKHGVSDTVFTFHSGKNAYQCGNENFSLYCVDVFFTHPGPYEIKLYEGTERVYRKSFHVHMTN